MIQDEAYDEIDRMWQRKEIEKKELTEYNKKREVIRLHDNEKYGVENWYGRKDYAPMSITEVEDRFMEVMIERGQT